MGCLNCKPAASGESDNEVNASNMSLSTLVISNVYEGEQEDYFPFQDLPSELIGHIFSFLSIEDRMNARVNKRLNKIESECKYHLNRLEIVELSKRTFFERLYYANKSGLQRIIFFEGRSYSSDCIRRVTKNATIGSLLITLTGSGQFQREVYSLIKDFEIGKLELRFENRLLEREMMVDSFFLDLTGSCKTLDLSKVTRDAFCKNVTPAALHQVYQMMLDGSTNLHKLKLNTCCEQLTPFLKLLGITYREGHFFAKGNIEAFEKVDYTRDGHKLYQEVRIFDGNSMISLHIDDYSGRLVDSFSELDHLSFELHETKESLEYAKNRRGFVPIDIVLE